MTQLKICPFCGGEADMEEFDGALGRVFACACTQEGCPIAYHDHGKWATRKEAITAWNTRANEMTWRTIDSAPRDGTEVLLSMGYGTVIGSWQKHTDISYPFLWKDMGGCTLYRPWKDELGPTHWMPLPPAPDSEGK